MCSKKYIQFNELSDVPKNPLYANGFSYRYIANDLEKLINLAYQDPTVQEFINNGDTNSAAFLKALNIAIQNVTDIFVSKPVPRQYNTPLFGFGRRVTLVSSDGSVLMDKSYENPFSGIFFANNQNSYQVDNVSQIVPFQDFAGVSTLPLPPYPLNVSQTHNIKVIKQTRTIYKGPVYPETPDDKTLWKYQDVQLHNNRAEVITANIQNYGWSTRQSGTTSNLAYYVAKKLVFNNNYTFIIRLSYETILL